MCGLPLDSEKPQNLELCRRYFRLRVSQMTKDLRLDHLDNDAIEIADADLRLAVCLSCSLDKAEVVGRADR